jgi:hypothetical protein
MKIRILTPEELSERDQHIRTKDWYVESAGKVCTVTSIIKVCTVTSTMPSTTEGCKFTYHVKENYYLWVDRLVEVLAIPSEDDQTGYRPDELDFDAYEDAMKGFR